MKKILLCFCICLGLFFSKNLHAQKRTLTLKEASLGRTEQGERLHPESLYFLQWVDSTSHLFYYSEKSFVIQDVSGEIPEQKIGTTLYLKYPQLRGIPEVKYINGQYMAFEVPSGFVLYNYQDNSELARIPLAEDAQNTDYNPHRKWLAFTRENNLFVATTQGETLPVTQHSDKNIVAGQSIHRSEFGIKKGTFWSPKGNFLAFYQKDESAVSDYPLVDVDAYPAKLQNIKYPMAGQPSERAAVGVYSPEKKKLIYLDINTQDEHYLTNLSWSPDEKYILLAEINRDQNRYELNCYDASTGKKLRTILHEENPKWVEPENPAVFIPNTDNNFLWISEKEGFMNVYWYTLKGKLVKKLTNFGWVVNEILGFSPDAKAVFVSGTGADARENHTYKINLKNNKISELTPEKGTHRTQLNYNGEWLVDEFSSVEIPQKIDVVQTQNSHSKNIFSAKNPLENFSVGTTEFLTLKADDGTPLFAKIHKPNDFDPQKKYPVLVYVYGGPHAQLVTNSWLAGSYLWQVVAAQTDQYIIFTLDNRGSANRGFAFESVIHRKLGEYEMKDQLAGIAYLQSLPYVDAQRIAVTGWSFGGFMTATLMLKNPEMFTTAVAGGAVTDWKYYEVMYGERYMDTPEQNPEGYQKARLENYIQNLKGKMMFIHGSVDDVVVPQHVMKILQAAVKKGIQLDFFLYPMHKHNVRGRDRAHLEQKIWQYILEHNHR